MILVKTNNPIGASKGSRNWGFLCDWILNSDGIAMTYYAMMLP